MTAPDDKTLGVMDDKALSLALLFHETYERLAPNYGYETRIATRKFDPDSPNGQLMIAVCGEIYRERIVALEAELFGQYKAPALSAGPLHTSVVPISTAPDCHRDEMP